MSLVKIYQRARANKTPGKQQLELLTRNVMCALKLGQMLVPTGVKQVIFVTLCSIFELEVHLYKTLKITSPMRFSIFLYTSHFKKKVSPWRNLEVFGDMKNLSFPWGQSLSAQCWKRGSGLECLSKFMSVSNPP